MVVWGVPDPPLYCQASTGPTCRLKSAACNVQMAPRYRGVCPPWGQGTSQAIPRPISLGVFLGAPPPILHPGSPLILGAITRAGPRRTSRRSCGPPEFPPRRLWPRPLIIPRQYERRHHNFRGQYPLGYTKQHGTFLVTDHRMVGHILGNRLNAKADGLGTFAMLGYRRGAKKRNSRRRQSGPK